MNKKLNSKLFPKVRSASFDEMKLEAQRTGSTLLLKQQSSSSTEDRSEAALLQVPQAPSQRSHSFDSAVSAGSDDSGAFLDVPRRLKQRRASSTKTPPPCIHCMYLEEYEKRNADARPVYFDPHELKSLSYSSSETEEDFLQEVADDDEDEDDDGSTGAHSVISEDEGVDDDGPHFGNVLIPPPPSTPCNIVFTLSPTTAFPLGSPPASPLLELPIHPLSPTIDFEACEPLLMPPPLSPSIELSLPPTSTESEQDQDDDSGEPVPPFNRVRRRSISRQEAVFVEPKGNSLENVTKEEESHDTPDSKKQPSIELCTLGVRDIYLAVPDLKRDRAASVDSCFSKVSSGGKTEEVQPNDGCYLDVPNISARSRSVDIVLPTAEQARYKALALSGSVGAYGYVLAFLLDFYIMMMID